MAALPWLPGRDRARDESSARRLWLPWLGLVVQCCVRRLAVAGALEVLPRKLSRRSSWDALGPLLVGSALAALAARVAPRFSADPDRWLPAGDIECSLRSSSARGAAPADRRRFAPRSRFMKDTRRDGLALDRCLARPVRAWRRGIKPAFPRRSAGRCCCW